jgi:hypothetical protein
MAMQIIVLVEYVSRASTGYPVCAGVVSRPIECKEARFGKFLGDACFTDSVWEVCGIPKSSSYPM